MNISKTLLLSLILILFLAGLPAGAEQDDFTEAELKLILAIDVSRSVLPYWNSIQAAVYSIIDELKPGDAVCPIAFGTFARTLSDKVIITGGNEKIFLRKIFESLHPTDDWTYYADLMNSSRSITNGDSSWIMLVITDCLSDPGPGRYSDYDFNRHTITDMPFEGKTVFVIRLIPNPTREDIIDKLRQEENHISRSIPDGSYVSSIPVDHLYELLSDLIPLLKEDIKQAKSKFNYYSASENENDRPDMPEQSSVDTLMLSADIDSSVPGSTSVTEQPHPDPEYQSDTPSASDHAKGDNTNSLFLRVRNFLANLVRTDSSTTVLQDSSGTKPIAQSTEPADSVLMEASDRTGNDEIPDSILTKPIKTSKKSETILAIWIRYRFVLIISAGFLLLFGSIWKIAHRKKEDNIDDKAEDESSLFEKPYFLKIQEPGLPVVSHQLYPDMPVTIGGDIPLNSIDTAIATATLDSGDIFIEPLLSGIMVNGDTLVARQQVYPSDTIRYQNVIIQPASEEEQDEPEDNIELLWDETAPAKNDSVTADRVNLI